MWTALSIVAGIVVAFALWLATAPSPPPPQPDQPHVAVEPKPAVTVERCKAATKDWAREVSELGMAARADAIEAMRQVDRECRRLGIAVLD